MRIEQTYRRPANFTRATALLACALIATSGTAWAKDSLAVSVTNATGSPVIVNNGQAIGTIQLFYTVNAPTFTTGYFATFDIEWLINQGTGRAPNYATGVTFELSQDQQGGYVDLVPSPNTFLLTTSAQTGKSTVTVYISTDKDGNMPPSTDGTDLVGNLKLDAGSDIGSVTNIQVHIRLVHPSTCLKVYNFITDQDFNLGILSSTNLNVVKNGPNAGKISSSQPGQFSDNVLIANVCATDQAFDLGIVLDSSFATSGNPAMAVKTYTADGEFDTSNYGTLLSVAAGQAPSLCLQNVTVPAGASFLATVHSKIKDGMTQSTVPADKSFDFSASLYQNVNAGCTGALQSVASPNPVTTTLPFTLNGI
jgi:hypothetical protein